MRIINQPLTAFSALINGGNLVKPYVVSQIVDDDGSVVYFALKLAMSSCTVS